MNGSKKRPYVGICKDGSREIFLSGVTPTEKDFPKYSAVIGAFQTLRGALFMKEHGRNNPHLQTVSDAERIAKRSV